MRTIAIFQLLSAVAALAAVLTFPACKRISLYIEVQTQGDGEEL